jgi:hypothetical protein
MTNDEHTTDRTLDPGAYIGREPELAAETIPGGVQPADERVAAGETQTGARVPTNAPAGHREPDGQQGDADTDG